MLIKGLLATSTLAIPLTALPSHALTFTTGNTSSFSNVPANFTGQGFTPNVGGDAADANFAIVLAANPSQVYLTNFTFLGISSTAPTQLNIYSNSDRTGLVASSTSNSGFSYTFNNVALSFGTTYYAFYPSDLNSLFDYTSDSYSGGNLYANGNSINSLDARFTATFTSPDAIPFEFSPTTGLVILGGFWGLKGLAKKISPKLRFPIKKTSDESL